MLEPMPKASAVGTPPSFEIIEWLTGDECHELEDAAMAAGLGQRLRSAGLPLDRLTLSLRRLHPEIIWRTVAWAPDEPVEIHDREYGLAQSVAFLGSPLRQVMETRRKEVVRVQGQSPDWMTDVLRGPQSR
jgi:adenylate cyclase